MSKQAKKSLTVYGTDWCGDCKRSRVFLEENEIDYRYVNIENDNKGLEFVKKVNNGNSRVPTIIFGDGSMLVEPTNSELAKKLNI